MWWANVRESTDQEINVDLKPFSLVQVNYDNNKADGDNFKYWEQDDSDNTLLELRAGVAAQRQGPEIWDTFFINLLRARHEDRIDLTDADAINTVAEASGVDMGRFAEDLADPEILREIGESHTEAVEVHGAFGVPPVRVPQRQFGVREDVYPFVRRVGLRLRQPGRDGCRPQARGRNQATFPAVAV